MSTVLEPDICVIGAGSAGLTVAAAASSFGHKVVLIERGEMGGDCLNYGCVPSKSLIAAAKHAHMARDGARFGIHAEPRVDYPQVHRHIHNVIASIAPHDSQERFEGLGVTVLRESARFVDERTVQAGETLIRARRTVIATGSRPMVPPIEGLEDAGFLTNESVFDLTALPERLAVIGGGPIGAELAQAFRRLGSRVTVLEAGPSILSRDDADAVAVVRAQMLREGVDIRENAKVVRVSREGDARRVHLDGGGTVVADEVLVAVGRRANVEDLDLGAAGITTHKAGIEVNAGLKTTNPAVFAIGDVVGGLQFTHVAGYHGSLAVRAIVFAMPVRFDADLMPRATYTAPELAQVGPTAAELDERGEEVTERIARLSGNDRAQAEGETEGFVKLLVNRKGRLAGATIVAPNAGDMIATYALAMAAKVPVKELASFTPAYPTFAEAGKRAAVTHFAEKLDKVWIRKVLGVLKRLK